MTSYVFLFALISVLAERAYSDTNYRLNVPIKPKSYAIAITPYFDTGDSNAFTFDGEVLITFNTESATRQIKLHSQDLTFDHTNITVRGANELPLDETNPLEFDTNYTFAIINLQGDLQIGVDYSLKIIYSGPIRKDLSGFYRNSYIENGLKKWLGTTQMEPTHARKVFPCFDEPSLKATFTLTIDRPESYQPTLTNTKMLLQQALPNGYVREIFYPTPVMSTYLVAFLISEYKGVLLTNGTKEFGVYSRPEALNQSDYAVDFGKRVVDALGDYFGIDYYSTNANLKLHHAAIVNFNAGAMENWGLVTYRENALLYVPEVSAPSYKYRVAQIVAHETTHMWFGNLVTCHWWSDTWLNEGFANYFQDYITSLIEPELGSADALAILSAHAAYVEDEEQNAPAISNENVNSPSEISAHFGLITYQKAGSVIRMMHHLMGDDAFKLGLNTYLQSNEFSPGYPNKMYEALDIGVRNYSALAAYPNTDIAEVMSSWITQPGHPILNVEINHDDGTVVLTQKRFFSNPKLSGNETYSIPITFTTGHNPDFEDTKPTFIMANTTHTFTIANISETHSWVIFNLQETGFYRVNYDGHSWQMIISALKNSEEREKIHHLNRAKIVNDIFAFYTADMVKFDLVMEVLESLVQEEHYAVWTVVLKHLKSLSTKYLGSAALQDIDANILRILEYPILRLGYEVRPSIDDYQTIRTRADILQLACLLEHEGCVEHALKLYTGLRDNGTEIHPSLYKMAYIVGLQHGDGEDYEYLKNKMESSNIANEQQEIMQTLGWTTDNDKLESYLLTRDEDGPIRTQDNMVPLTTVLSNYHNVPFVLDSLKQNYTLWTTIYERMDTALSTVAAALHSEQDFTEFEEFLTSCTGCTEQAITAARNSLQKARDSTTWAKDHQDDILANLRNHSVLVAPSMLLIITLTVMLEAFQCFA